MTSSYQPLDDPEQAYRPHQFHIVDPNIQYLQERDQGLKTRVRKFRIIIRILEFACSVVVVSLMIANLAVFYNTVGTISNGVRLWPEKSKLWPTYVTLGVAALSTVLSTATLLAYFWGTKYANRWNMARTTLTVVTIIFSIILWLIAVYGLQSTSSFEGVGSQSLWSSTCDSTDQQHELFGHVINLNQLCLMQEWGFICATISIGLEILTAISYIYVILRIRHKKQMGLVTMNPPVYVEPPSPVPSPFLDTKHKPHSVSESYSEY